MKPIKRQFDLQNFWIVHSQILRIEWCFLHVHHACVTFLDFGGDDEEIAMVPTFKKFIK